MAPVVDKQQRDIAVQAMVSLLVSTTSVQTDGQLAVEATRKSFYASVAMQVTQVPTGLRNGIGGGPVHPTGVMGP